MKWSDWSTRWPHADHSTFVQARPYRWHVQQMGEGPDVVLIHGAGGSTHSWRGLLPMLAQRYRVTAMDLPGHGFTPLTSGSRSGLPPMAHDLMTLIEALRLRPAALVGHSAGGALALRVALDLADDLPVVTINGAFQMFDGIAGFLFPLMAKALALNPLTVPFFTAAGSLDRTRRLLRGTGSQVDDEGLRLYHALISDKAHVKGALAMMSQWSLDRLLRDASHLRGPALLIAGERDRTVPISVSGDMAARLPRGAFRPVPDLGHLMHEEDPGAIHDMILPFLTAHLSHQTS